MASYNKQSQDKLSQCHEDLQTIFNYVIPFWDNTIITGHRGKKEQGEKFDKGLSKVDYPRSKHNSLPSMAVDAVPFPSLYSSRDNMIAFGGFVMGVAEWMYHEGKIAHRLRWGANWKGDRDLENNGFDDPGHFELIC